jgi:hypothetical protein
MDDVPGFADLIERGVALPQPDGWLTFSPYIDQPDVATHALNEQCRRA